LLEVAVFISGGFNTSQGKTESSVFWGCTDKMSNAILLFTLRLSISELAKESDKK